MMQLWKVNSNPALRGMELQEKEAKKSQNIQEICLERTFT